MERDAADEPRRAVLLVLAGPQEGLRIPLVSDELILGRSPRADLTFSDEGVSREHASLCYDHAVRAWTLEDLQSTNGTRVNGKRIRTCTLHLGDEIELGKLRLRVTPGS